MQQQCGVDQVADWCNRLADRGWEPVSVTHAGERSDPTNVMVGGPNMLLLLLRRPRREQEVSPPCPTP